jgi:hypothetical protein
MKVRQTKDKRHDDVFPKVYIPTWIDVIIPALKALDPIRFSLGSNVSIMEAMSNHPQSS